MVDGFSGEPIVVPAAVRGYRSWVIEETGLSPRQLPAHLNAAFDAVYINAGLSPVRRPDYVLQSLAWDITWNPDLRVQTATCVASHRRLSHLNYHNIREEYSPPVRHCSCGFYGWYNMRHVAGGGNRITGVVEASGRVILGTKGFRAEKVQLLALCSEELRWRDRRKAKRLGEIYDVPLYRRTADMLSDFPPQDVRELVADAEEPVFEWYSPKRLLGGLVMFIPLLLLLSRLILWPLTVGFETLDLRPGVIDALRIVVAFGNGWFLSRHLLRPFLRFWVAPQRFLRGEPVRVLDDPAK